MAECYRCAARVDLSTDDHYNVEHSQWKCPYCNELNDERETSVADGVELWRGEFGNEYTDRNQVDWYKRTTFWSRTIRATGARSVFELGCNAGWNLSAIREYHPRVQVTGSDINERALEQAHAAGLTTYNCLDFRAVPGRFDLVFTAGVLIHIEPEHVREVMAALIDKSFRWVLAIEYESEYEEPIHYRGHGDKCWKRPYHKLYMDLGLHLVDRSVPAGFDNCTAWLFEK